MDETNNVVNTTSTSVQQETQKAAGIAIGALILGICSIVFCCIWYVSLITGVVAIVLAVKAKKDNVGGQGMAKAGMICGIVGIVLAVLYIFVIAGILASTGYLDALS